MKAQSMSLDAVARHFHEVQVHPIVNFEDHSGSDPCSSIQEPYIGASFSVGHKIDPLAIAGIACASGCV